jgi:F-type H+-transporting ATPase subunit delta
LAAGIYHPATQNQEQEMHNPRLAARYAKALIDFSIEKNQLENVYADILWLQEIYRQNPDFVNVLKSPVIKAGMKRKIIEAIIAGKVHVLTSSFFSLLITKTRESNLPEIITAFIKQYKTYKNIHTVKLTTAVKISDDIKNEIIAQVKKTAGIENIELETIVKEELIGGFVLVTGDQLVDASIAYDLKNLARQFENNDFIYRLR